MNYYKEFERILKDCPESVKEEYFDFYIGLANELCHINNALVIIPIDKNEHVDSIIADLGKLCDEVAGKCD